MVPGVFAQPRFGVEHYTGPGIGYRESFSTLEGFLPIFQNDANIIFVDAHAILSNQSYVSFNTGVGYRWLDEETNRVWGVNSFYDTRDFGQRNLHQFGFGVETLGSNWDARANYYQAINGYCGDPRFSGRVILLRNQMSGGDVEVGTPVPYLADYGVKAFAGSYVLSGDHGVGTGVGVKARVEYQVTENISLNCEVANDRFFNNTVVLSGALRFGGERGLERADRTLAASRMADFVRRQRQIMLADSPAIDPRTGKAIPVVHVDNRAAPGGDGTVERPLQKLEGAPAVGGPFAIIFVRRGNGTSQFYDTGVNLVDDQRLLGDGVHHVFQSHCGTFFLPGITPGARPIITNTNGHAVTLANGTEVSGFTITGASRNGIFGQNVFGNITITNNIVSNNVVNGLALINNTGSVNLLLQNNTFDSNGIGAAIAGGEDNNGVRIRLQGDALLSARILNNDINRNGGFAINGSNGFYLRLNDNSIARLNVRDNRFNDGSTTGFYVLGQNNSTLQLLFQGNTVVRNGGPLAGRGAILEFSNNSIGVVAVRENTFADNQDGGFQAIASNNAQLCLDLFGNQANEASGYNLQRLETSLFPLEPTSNIGILTTVGTITPVPDGTCQPSVP